VLLMDPSFFNTVHYIFMKPLIFLGFFDQGSNYDISVELTKIYYPNDWETMHATQQWPLVTNLYYNYYGFYFGWIPILLYAYILSWLYMKMINGVIPFSLIFILEFIRLFSVERGVFIPWQMPVYLMYYLLIYLVLQYTVKLYWIKR